MAVCVVTLASVISTRSQGVTARLHVPPSEVYVIGDDIPLLWRFTNRDSDPLAFLWEGCCRLNGRLEVTREDGALAPIPPGSSLAHQFAKAEVLEPGVPGEFKTLLSDWVQLHETGRYWLQGRYVGVLPSQQPQVPADMKLWRGAATTDTVALSVLSPEDYLEQRDARSRQRGLRVSLKGPEALPPLGSVSIEVIFENLEDSPQSLYWPGPAQLWILNERSERVGLKFLEKPLQELSVPPRASLRQSFLLGADDLLDAPLGTYRVFVDYAGDGADRPRLPSNALKIDWSLGDDDVRALVDRASQGPSRGLRNPALKRLRVYLDQIRGPLSNLNLADLSQDASGLARDLQLAACLKSYAPIPGAVEIPLAFGTEGDWSLRPEVLGACLAEEDLRVGSSLDRILSVRRHLGWSVQLRATPASTTRMDDVFKAAASVATFADRLSGPLATTVVLPDLGMTNTVGFRTNLMAANLVLRISDASVGAAASLAIARRAPDPTKPQWINRWTSTDVPRLPFEALEGGEALEAWLSGVDLQFPQITVLADRQLTWGQVLAAIQPFMRRGWSLEIAPF